MNESVCHDKSTVSTWLEKHSWLKGQLKRSIQFSQPLTIVKERLKLAFANTITEYHGLLFPSFNYAATFEGNNVKLEYSKSGKNGMSFSMTGCFSENSKGTKLDIVVKDSLLSYLPIFVMPLMILFNRSTFVLWPFIIIVVPIIVIFFTALHRDDAADDITVLLHKIVN